MQTKKIFYWVVTILFSIWMLMSGFMFIFQTEMVINEVVAPIGAPKIIVMPLGIAKVLGVVTILFIKAPLIKRFAYLGFTVNLLSASYFHLVSGDQQWPGPLIALALMTSSYVFWSRISKAA